MRVTVGMRSMIFGSGRNDVHAERAITLPSYPLGMETLEVTGFASGPTVRVGVRDAAPMPFFAFKPEEPLPPAAALEPDGDTGRA
jgi:hypothetical protein